MTFIIVLPILGYLLYRLVLYPRFFSPLRHIPGPPLGYPITGQFGAILRGEAGIPQREWVKQYGPVVRVVGPVGIERLIFMTPEAIHKILVSDWVEYPRPTFMRRVLAMVTGNGLLTVEGNEHRQMRKVMNPAFALPNIMAQSDMYYDAIEGLIDIIGAQIDSESDSKSDGKIILMYEWLSKATLDIISSTAFGYNSNSLHNPHNELAEAYDTLTALQTGPNLSRFIAVLSFPFALRFLSSEWAYKWRHWFELTEFTRLIKPMTESMRRIKRVSASILAEKLHEANAPSSYTSAPLASTTPSTTAPGASADASSTLAPTTTHPYLAVQPSDAQANGKRDIMSLLVRARKAQVDRDILAATAGEKGGPAVNTKGYTMSDSAMMDQVLTFLGAGHETTASGLAWTLYLLATHPAVQAKLREEVVPLFTTVDGDEKPRPGYRALKELVWLDCVITESLRLLPPVPMSFRQASKTDYIDGVLVPEGTLFYIPIRVINTWTELWGPDAESFNPARFLPGALPASVSGLKNPALANLTFLAGPHACIGKTMAVAEMKAVVAALIAHFEFAPAYPDQVAQPTAAITMKPKDYMPLRVRRVGLITVEGTAQ